MRKAIIIITAIFIVLSLATPRQEAVFAAGSREAAPQGIYALWNEGEYDRFTNYAGGYSLHVDKGMYVDMSIAGVCAILESATKRIEIFNQPLGRTVSMADYTAYSNGFLKNRVDHTYEYQGYQEIGGRNIHITQWSRKKLSRVKNDKNYYACLDIPVSSSEVITIMVSSTMPLYQNGDYRHLMESFEYDKKTQPRYVRKAANTNAAGKNWNDETKEFYNKYFGKDAGLTWGIFEPKAPEYFQDLQETEKLLDYEFPVILNYSSFESTTRHSDLEYRLKNTYDAGKTLELTLQTSWTSDNHNQVYRILDGVYDEFLRNYAKTIADFGHPVIFRLCNEMNGDWCPYSGWNTSRDPQIYIELYKYVYSFFEGAGAKNVIWVWNPNSGSFPDFTWNNELMYYPGDEYVDVIGLTAYNTGNYYKGETWKSFADLYDNFYYGYVDKYDKPMMITEFSSATTGGDKNRWVIDMFGHIKYYDKIKIAVWWDGADYDTNGAIARSYFIDDPVTLIETFRKGLRGDYNEERPQSGSSNSNVNNGGNSSAGSNGSNGNNNDVSWKENVFA
ncbi:MAG: glycoside hydrolase family 26 protein [Clostridiales Family XIII bacterium]|nr:glycoside hydrolase family 26 protein [Clostridiales Family XIII bacterium]